jgi:hypothetical protein
MKLNNIGFFNLINSNLVNGSFKYFGEELTITESIVFENNIYNIEELIIKNLIF